MKYNVNKISKEDFLKIKEEDIIFITNPGRMGDEDGLIFIIKQDNEFKIYRIDGFIYRSKDTKESEYFSLHDVKKQFPKWNETRKNNSNENYKGKYTYLYM